MESIISSPSFTGKDEDTLITSNFADTSGYNTDLILKYAPNKANAIKLLEFLLTKEAQQHIVNNTFEYPMIDGVKPNKLIAQFGLNFKQDLKTKVSSYGKNQAAALKVMTEAGWE